MTPEGQILRAITDLLTAERVLWFRMNSGGMFGSHKGKRWAVKFGTKGMSDILAFQVSEACLLVGEAQHTFEHIRPTWIEVKGPTGKQTTEQYSFQQLVESHGHIYWLARSSDDVLAWLKRQRAGS